jgi:DnaJ family protein C protein 27
MMATRRIKIITLGPCEVGKSALIKRFCENRFERRYYKTIGVDYGSINVNVVVNGETGYANDVKVDFFDLSGDPDHFEIRNEFYHDIDGCLLVYDFSDPKTFEQLEKWLQEGRRFGLQNKIPMVLCANKTDLVEEIEIPKGQRVEFSKKHDMRIFHTSALNGSNVALMFEHLFHEALCTGIP